MQDIEEVSQSSTELEGLSSHHSSFREPVAHHSSTKLEAFMRQTTAAFGSIHEERENLSSTESASLNDESESSESSLGDEMVMGEKMQKTMTYMNERKKIVKKQTYNKLLTTKKLGEEMKEEAERMKAEGIITKKKKVDKYVYQPKGD